MSTTRLPIDPSTVRRRGPEAQYRPIPEHLYPSPAQVRYVQPAVPRRMSGPDADRGLFLDWLVTLGRLLMLPVTLPIKTLSSLLRSPLTLSLLIRLTLLALLLTVSGIVSTLAVGGWWLSWGRMGERSVEGWFVYGSKSRPTPHSYISLPPSASAWHPDVIYDVEVELELIRPRWGKGGEESGGNFMISVDFLSEKTNEPVLTIAQPVALPYVPSSFLFSLLPSLPSFPIPLTLNPYIILASLSPVPLPFAKRKSSHLTYSKSSKKSKDTFLLTRALTGPGDRGVVMRPSGGLKGKPKEERAVGGLVVSVGREDGVAGGAKEVKTTGWVVVRMVPRPTGLRWLLTSHPIPPLLILPPIAIFLTLTSALTSYLIITYCFRNTASQRNPNASLPQPKSQKRLGDGTDGSLFSQTGLSNGDADRMSSLANGSQTGLPQLVLTTASSLEQDKDGPDLAGDRDERTQKRADARNQAAGSVTSGGDVTPSESTSDPGSVIE